MVCGSEIYLSFALPMFRASVSMMLYAALATGSSFGVGVSAAMPEAAVTIAVATLMMVSMLSTTHARKLILPQSARERG